MEKLDKAMNERYAPANPQQTDAPWQAHRQKGRVWTGVFLLLIGAAALLRLSFPMPEWLFSWPMLLIALGLFMGLRHNFKQGPWFVLLLIGSIFLIKNNFPGIIDHRIVWPLVLMGIGFFLIIRPTRSTAPYFGQTAPAQKEEVARYEPGTAVPDELLESTSIFGGIKKTILSKTFRGGELVNIMGGTELNLSQADIQGTVVLEVTQIFGGTKIIVPPHWEVKPEMAAIFGGIDDKRFIQPGAVDHTKVLLLKGTSVFGGIEVRSF